MKDAALAALRDRCHRAALRGYTIAHADLYLAAMVKEAGDVDPPLGTAVASAAHLAAAAQAVLEVRAGTKKKGKTKKKAAPEPTPKPLAAAPKAAAEEDVEVEAEDEALGYEDWSYKELMATAQECEISGRSSMSKEELAEALYAWDEEHGE
jgi:hypothetical protein